MEVKAMIQIDYTWDFVADNGALSCQEPAQKIESTIYSLTKEFIENGDYVVLAVDVHEEGDTCHPETELFPPHNLRGTKGRDLYGSVKELVNENKNHPNVYFMDKTRYSAFAGTDLEMKLRERGITELHLVGVCTDICVLHTAIDAYNKGFSIVVHQNAVASFNEKGHEWSLDHFRTVLGARVI
ncbi:isochorismatase family cysteine hydrolase [Bacillus spongiae]|uniref:Isochorismatase family cysteine hydrolase n=1 Tax=Bacillus spongiae TaxID=2683610 RepID=A0ABU8HG71_9BACI